MMKTPAILTILILAVLGAEVGAKGKRPRREVVLSAERMKNTVLGPVHLKGKAWIAVEGDDEITDEIWHKAALEEGTLARPWTLNGLTFPSETKVTIHRFVEDEVTLSVFSPKEISICGVKFAGGKQSLTIRFQPVRFSDGRATITGKTRLFIAGALHEDAVVSGYSLQPGHLHCEGVSFQIADGNPSGLHLRSGVVGKATTIFGDIALEAGDQVSFGTSMIRTRLNQASWLRIHPRKGRTMTVRGHKNVRHVTLDRNNGRIARLLFAVGKPALIKGILARRVDYYPTGAVYEIDPPRYAKWNGIPLVNDISFWPNGNVQQAYIVSSKELHPGGSNRVVRRDIDELQGVPLDGVGQLRFNPRGELRLLRLENDYFRVKDGRLTAVSQTHPLAHPDHLYEWVRLLKKE